MNRLKWLGCLALVLLLSGCKVQLYTGLTEREGNEMLAMLLDAGIESEKLMDKDGNVSLSVSNSDVSRSIRLLRSNGLPRDRFSSVSDIFPKDGLISSPVEERARYTYSMSQELSSTLSLIDGILTARVHVVLPPNGSAGPEETYPSSASVFIKYTPDLELAGFIPKVKTLVANSIEGLSLDKITVSLFPTSRIGGEVQGIPIELDSVLSIDVSPESSSRMLLIFGMMTFLMILSLAGSGVLFWLWWRARKSNSEADDDFEEDLPADAAEG